MLFTVLADANFPSASICRNGPELVRADGHGIPALLKAVTYLFPLDTYVPAPVSMFVVSIKGRQSADCQTEISSESGDGMVSCPGYAPLECTMS